MRLTEILKNVNWKIRMNDLYVNNFFFSGKVFFAHLNLHYDR